MCTSSVVPESGVTPSSCANLNRACAEVQFDALAMAIREGYDNNSGEPDNVQNDLVIIIIVVNNVTSVAGKWNTHWYWISCSRQ